MRYNVDNSLNTIIENVLVIASVIKHIYVQKSYLQTDAAFIVTRIRTTLVFPFKSFVQTDITNFTMKAPVFMNATDATLVAVVGLFVTASEVFTFWTEILGQLCSTVLACLSIITFSHLQE